MTVYQFINRLKEYKQDAEVIMSFGTNNEYEIGAIDVFIDGEWFFQNNPNEAEKICICEGNSLK